MIRTFVVLALAAFTPGALCAPATQPGDAAHVDLLDRTLPEIAVDAVALGDAIDFLRDILGAKFEVNWQALNEAGVRADSPISVRLRNIIVGKALAMILDEAGKDRAKLAYWIDGGVIRIDTAENRAKRLPSTSPSRP
jgi:hypothetical protein